VGSNQTDTLATYLASYESLVEVGIGSRHAVAKQLAERGCSIIATDITAQSLPPDITFVCDDLTDPTNTHYENAEALYFLRCPPELQRPLCELGSDINADVYFTTLGSDPAVVPVTRTQIPGTTLFQYRDNNTLANDDV